MSASARLYRTLFTYLFRWLDSEFVMLDANFQLKSKQRNLVDPPLGDGLAYYVENEVYMSHVKACGEQTEVRRLRYV